MKFHAFIIFILLSSHQFILLVLCEDDSTQNDLNLNDNNFYQNVRRRAKRNSGNFFLYQFSIITILSPKCSGN